MLVALNGKKKTSPKYEAEALNSKFSIAEACYWLQINA